MAIKLILVLSPWNKVGCSQGTPSSIRCQNETILKLTKDIDQDSALIDDLSTYSF